MPDNEQRQWRNSSRFVLGGSTGSFPHRRSVGPVFGNLAVTGQADTADGAGGSGALGIGGTETSGGRRINASPLRLYGLRTACFSCCSSLRGTPTRRCARRRGPSETRSP